MFVIVIAWVAVALPPSFSAVTVIVCVPSVSQL
jgi:hypothetical protein